MLAKTPPMGWNSWDCYYSSANEKVVMDNARYIAEKGLDEYGWEYVVLDIRWYANHPSLGGGNYNQRGDQDCVLDEYGRYLPSPSRFPSCMVDGVNQGFKAMADSIHRMGLKFGIHLMRGLPKVAAEKPAGEWQHVSITLYKRHITIVLNGVTIIDNEPVTGVTGGAMDADEFKAGPIYLQGDHSDADYRNMILRPAL